MSQPKVVIVGTGFAGREAVAALGDEEVEVLLLDRHNYHLFWPLLYQVAIGGLEPEEIGHPARAIARRHRNVRFRMAEVEGLDLNREQLLTNQGPINYDYLILAAGSRPNFFGLDSVEQVAYSLGGINDAIALRNHVLRCFEEAVQEPSAERRQALLTFVIVGGGPTGVELAGALAELKRHALPRDFPDIRLAEVRILLLEMLDAVLPPFSKSLQAYTQQTLLDRGVEVMLNTTVERAECDAVHLKGGKTIPTGTVIWSAGVRSQLGDALPFETERGGRTPVAETLQVPGHPDIYAAGDMAYLTGPEGKPYPQLAPVAMQQGEAAARNILRAIKGQDLKPFRYQDRGTLATIGRSAAAADIFGQEITGFVAWFLWLAVHIFYLMGFRNRVQVLINWAYSYLKYDPAARLIVGVRKECEVELEG
jgi:NADH dehydrogenase